jgi:hypothetical protein
MLRKLLLVGVLVFTAAVSFAETQSVYIKTTFDIRKDPEESWEAVVVCTNSSQMMYLHSPLDSAKPVKIEYGDCPDHYEYISIEAMVTTSDHAGYYKCKPAVFADREAMNGKTIVFKSWNAKTGILTCADNVESAA